MKDAVKYFTAAERLSFQYGETPFWKVHKTVSDQNEKGAFIKEILLPDGLKISKTVRAFEAFGAYEWVTWFENTSDKESGIISELYDGDFQIPFDRDEIPPSKGCLPGEQTAKIYNPIGSIWSRTEFSCEPQTILPGETKYFATNGGRSSQQNAPFFDISQKGKGVIFAVGWTGQWRCIISRDNNEIRVQAGIENVRFKLYPGEKIRTASVLVMPYECGQEEAHNQFRRLLKQEFSLVGQQGRETEGPLSHMFWGAMTSNQMLGVIRKIQEHDLGFEYIWVDAGWYGSSTQDCPNEFEGDWPVHTGDWNVNLHYHPDEFEEVSKAVRKSGMKFMLWLEPERCNEKSPIARSHPEWFLKRKENVEGSDYWLLNLGNQDALRYAVELISRYVQKLDLSCYRQDFNVDPLPYWDENEEEDRKGILQIKHIMGLYAFWDTLLQRFPHLMIDNCASGGRRIDIETLRRSMVMWRSDYQCTWNFDPETSQTHSSSFSWWLPYTGTGAGGIIGDTYRTRSCYAASLTMNYWGYVGREFKESDVQWVRRINEEYKKVRPFLSCDFYPVILSPMDDSNWVVSQYNRPEHGDGVILAFRRPLSVCDRAQIQLKGLQEYKQYVFYDADSTDSFEISGKELLERPLSLFLPEKRSSKLIFYKEKNKI